MKSFRIYIWKDIKDDEMFKDIVNANKDRVNDYINVMIFDSYEKMYEKVDKIEEDCDNDVGNNEHNYLGRTLMCRKQLYNDDETEIWGYSKAQGFIFMCGEEGITFNTVSHEVGHAVFEYMGAYFKDKIRFTEYSDEKYDENTLYEELFCYITGSLNNQICVKVG